jgi:hypothetical protein
MPTINRLKMNRDQKKLIRKCLLNVFCSSLFIFDWWCRDDLNILLLFFWGFVLKIFLSRRHSSFLSNPHFVWLIDWSSLNFCIFYRAIPRMIMFTRIANIVLSFLMIVVSLLSLLTTQTATTGVLACYVTVFSCLLCCYKRIWNKCQKLLH